MRQELNLDWKTFLERHDLVWDEFPSSWAEGAFIGNGLLGAMIYRESDREIAWYIGRTDVTQRADDIDPIAGKHRIPIGKLVLKTKGNIQSCSMRLDLWNAEVRCHLKTDLGEMIWRSFAHAEHHVIVVNREATGEETDASWTWVPAKAENPRNVYSRLPQGSWITQPPAEIMNPNVRQVQEGNMHLSVQELAPGGEYTTAWMEMENHGRDKDFIHEGDNIAFHNQPDKRSHKVLFISVGFSFPERSSRHESIKAVETAASKGWSGLRHSHRSWWNAYYPSSMISLPDKEIEKFYWIQIYKLASGTRANRPALDLMGPWMDLTPWPAVWWNLNIQLTYWPVYTANRLELGESLCRMLDDNIHHLIQNVPESYRYDSAAIGRTSGYDCRSPVYEKQGSQGIELGNLTWACHNYWLQYRYSMDEAMLRDRLFPLLRRAICFYLHLLEEGKDGQFHLPVAVSPEYPNPAADTNYDLSLLRWGCETLIAVCNRLGITDPLLPRWHEVLEKLTDYPTDENGLMIGKDVPLAQSHRHASHLLMIYPLYLLNGDQPGSRAFIEKSLEHWIQFEGALEGYSYTIASSIYAALGRGNEALNCLKSFLAGYSLPNTLYREAGPCMETPLSAASSLHNMLLQSWGETIRVFPAIPDSWEDISFERLRAEGAFLVSASRKDGVTQNVRIESLAGEPCRVQTDLPLPIRAKWLPSVPGAALSEREATIHIIGSEDGLSLIEIDIGRDESVILYSGRSMPE